MPERPSEPGSAWPQTWMWVLLVFGLATAWSLLRMDAEPQVSPPGTVDARPSLPPGAAPKESAFQQMPARPAWTETAIPPAAVPESDWRALRYLQSLEAHGAFERARAASSNEYEHGRMYLRERQLRGLAEQYPQAYATLQSQGRQNEKLDALSQSFQGKNLDTAVFTAEEWYQIRSLHAQDLRNQNFDQQFAEAESDAQRAWILEKLNLLERPDIIPIP